jgi:predicted metal-dependent HD superfamily phosphohydrolase
VPDEAFRAGRAKVLRAFLSRQSLFTTLRLAKLWERKARANLTAECERLERSVSE